MSRQPSRAFRWVQTWLAVSDRMACHDYAFAPGWQDLCLLCLWTLQKEFYKDHQAGKITEPLPCGTECCN